VRRSSPNGKYKRKCTDNAQAANLPKAISDVSVHCTRHGRRTHRVIHAVGRYSEQVINLLRRLRFSSDADIVRLTNARIIIIIIINLVSDQRYNYG